MRHEQIRFHRHRRARGRGQEHHGQGLRGGHLLAAGPVPHVAAALASVGGIETSLVRHAAFFALPEPAADAAAAVPVPA